MNDQEFYISVQQGGTAALPCRVQSTPPPTLRSEGENSLNIGARKMKIEGSRQIDTALRRTNRLPNGAKKQLKDY